MKFHLPSFLCGFAAGAGAHALKDRLRPIFMGVATAGYKLMNTLAVHAARRREDLQDLFAEARSRARRATGEARDADGSN